MGQGGHVVIINATKKGFTRTAVTSNHMSAWNDNFPQSIPAGQHATVYVEWGNNILSNDDSGLVTYSMDGGSSFTLTASAGPYELSLNATKLSSGQVAFPPTPYLGWEHDGTLSVAICELPSASAALHPFLHSPTSLSRADPVTLDNILSRVHSVCGGDPWATSSEGRQDLQRAVQELAARAARYTGEQPVGQGPDPVKASWTKSWMKIFSPAIGHMKVRDLCIPGTHDSGTYSMELKIADPWAKTQNLTIKEQLEAGVRCIDVRTGCQPSKKGTDEEFVMTHDVWKTTVTMRDCLSQVLAFCHENPQEVVVLDYHRFVTYSDGDHFDHSSLTHLITTQLGAALVPHSECKTGIADLAQKGMQVVVCYSNGARPSQLWPGLSQHWYESAKSLDDLQKAIEKDLGSNAAMQPEAPLDDSDNLWSICCVLPAEVLRPIPCLAPDCDNWFFAGSRWAGKANVISVDIVEKTFIPMHCVCENLLRATTNGDAEYEGFVLL